MTIPGGQAHLPPRRQLQPSSVLGAPASLIGSEFPPPGLRPSLCPGPMRQDVSYVHHANLYIRNTLPDDMSISSSASPGLSGRGFPGLLLGALPLYWLAEHLLGWPEGASSGGNTKCYGLPVQLPGGRLRATAYCTPGQDPCRLRPMPTRPIARFGQRHS
jgi:hypothetical protein